MNGAQIVVEPTATGVAIEFAHSPIVIDLGVSIPLQARWRWSFDGTLHRGAPEHARGSDLLGEFESLVFIYADEAGPLVRQAVKSYQGHACVVVETTALREIRGTFLEDSFFNTTFNSPVVRLGSGLNYLVYTWGLLGDEGPGIGGNFPDVALARDLAALPEQLRLADFFPTKDLHQTTEKPFAPLIAYDSQERTLVMSPLNHYLVSPMRLLKTPDGTAVVRGLHGSVNVIAEGMTTRTLLTFGTGMVSTVLKWGELLTRSSGKEPGGRWDSLAVRTLGFWNCYGGYYAELFRQTNAVNLSQLSQHFTEVDLPVRYWGLDLWYQFHTVGFAARYLPDPIKYPHGLKELFETTGIPFMLHMSAFDRDNHYLDSHDFAVGEGSAYPAGPELYRELALEFKNWGATGIWHDFLRVQMQNCRSLRDQVGLADQWFDNLATATSEQGLDVMLCMPTIGHYLASAAHDNVVAVRTSTDYVNHQPGQLELLSRLDEYRSGFSPQGNLRQNLMLSFLAGALGLAPSHDVFISNREHPEGFANPHAERDALMRALSAGIVGLGDKLGFVDREVAGKLAFPDGSLAQPGHPLYPVASSLQSDVLTFYTGTFISGYRWTYLVLVNLTEDTAEYRLDLEPLLLGNECMVYDYHAGEVVTDRMIAGQAQPGEGRYLIVVPKVAGIYPLGFPDKYVTLPKRQVKEIRVRPEGVTIDLELPVERKYTFAVVGTDHLSATGQGIKVESVETRGELTCIEFMVDSPRCSLLLQS